ncbi:MAG: hypothetical protein P4L57_12925 [Rhizomicrobium sp.]|nr:hypothetical protein [Rhizomicrobium sp.]
MRNIMIAAAAFLLMATAAGAGDFGAGFGVSSNATARDVGLPSYPGAWPHKDKDGDSGANVWGAFGAFGLKVAAVEMDSNDQPGRIAEFYKNALRHYGPILDCSPGRPFPPKAAENSNRLDCSDGDSKPGSLVFKVGVKQNFRIVAIEPRGQVSKIALVAIQLRGVH